MAFAVDTFTGDGSNAGPFTVSFPFLSKDHVIVSVDGVVQTIGSGNDYTFPTASTILFTAGSIPAAASDIKFTRKTSHTLRLVDYTTPGPDVAALNTDSKQGFFMAQEVVDIGDDKMSRVALANEWDADNERISNVATPTADNDAANKAYADSTIAAAAASATAAATSATNASTSESGASASVTAASTSETNAATSATTAATSETNAATSATTAATSETNAADSASTAAAVAQTAVAPVKNNVLLNAFRIAVNGGLSVLNMVDGIVDEYEDETGIDTIASVNETHDAVGDFYSNTSDDLTAGETFTASSEDEAVSRLFDDSQTTDWASNADDTAWVQVQFAAAKAITKLVLKSGGDGFLALPDSTIRSRHPNAFTLSGSNTGAFGGEEVLLLTESASFTWSTASNETRVFDFSNVTAFSFYRLDLTGKQIPFGDGSEYFIAEMELISTGLDLTLQSNAFTAVTQPDEARIVVFEEDVDVVTLNTDLLAWASRDGGVTWTQVTLADDGDFETGKQILTGSIDISAQPAGTSMKYKLTTLNTKELKVHGVALQWS